MLSGEKAVVLIFKVRIYTDIKAEEEIILIFKSKDTAIYRGSFRIPGTLRAIVSPGRTLPAWRNPCSQSVTLYSVSKSFLRSF